MRRGRFVEVIKNVRMCSADNDLGWISSGIIGERWHVLAYRSMPGCGRKDLCEL